MATNHPKAGPNSVPAYQLSGIPYVTGSGVGTQNLSAATRQIGFPFVTRFITFSNNTSNQELYVSFTAHGQTGVPSEPGLKNIFVVPGGTVVNLDVRCKTVFLRSSDAIQWSMCAGLTTIGKEQFPTLTGSINGTTGFEGVG